MTPQQELAALRRLAELEAKAAGVPAKPLPGLGQTASGMTDAQARELQRAGAPQDGFDSLLQGGAYGGAKTAVGLGQIASRVLPHVPGQQQYMDSLARKMEQGYAQQPGSDTAAGRTGEFIGGTVATAPLAYLSVPAKGAGFFSAVGRGSVGGGAMAGSQATTGDFASEKLKQVGIGSALGGGIPAAGRGLMALGERVYGPNILSQLANVGNKSANRSIFAQEGEDLASRTRIPMTPGQVSGSKMQTGIESMARQSFFSADKAFEADKRAAEGAVKYVNRVMDNISRNPASEAAIGTQIQAATRGAVTKIGAQRDKIAAQQYGAIDAAVGNKPFVQPNAAMQAADDIIAQYGAVPSPEAARIVAQATALKEQLQKKGGFTLSEAQKARSYYGRATQGGASVFDDVSHEINRTIAKKIFGAMSDDIDASAARLETSVGPGIVPQGYFGSNQMGAGGGGLGAALKEANANYRRYSQMIEGTKSHPIARLFGDKINVDDVMVFDKIPPETVISRLGQMKPTELRMVRDFMENESPEAWQQYKRLLVDNALSSARTLPTSAGANTVPFNASQFVRTLGGDKPDKIKQLQAVFSADEFSQIDDAFSAARRLGDRFGYNGSGTGPYMEVQSFLQSIKDRSFAAVASTGGEALGLRKVANVMLNADGRRALIQLSKLPPQSRQAASLMGLLASLAAGQNTANPDDQQNAGK